MPTRCHLDFGDTLALSCFTTSNKKGTSLSKTSPVALRRPDARRLAITDVLDLIAGLLFGDVLGAGLTVLLLHGRRWFHSRCSVLPVPSIDMPPLEDILRAEFHCGFVLPVLGPLPELVKLENATISPEISTDFDRPQLWDSVSIQIDAQPIQEDPEPHSVCTSSETLPLLRPRSPRNVSEKEELQEAISCSVINLFSTPASALPTLSAWQKITKLPMQLHQLHHVLHFQI